MEGQASIGEMIRFSWAKSRGILFPFHFKRWFKILIIVSLAGAGVQGGSLHFSAPGKSARSVRVMGKTMPSSSSSVTAAPGKGSSAVSPRATPASPVSSADASVIKSGASSGSPKPVHRPVLNFWLVTSAVLLGLGLMLFFMWLSSRFNFILLNTIVTGNTAVCGPFRGHRELGNSYFRWSLAFLGIMLGAFLIIGFVGYMLFGIAKGHIVLMILLGILMGLLALTLLLGMMGVGTSMRDLVLPIMCREKITALDAMNQFLDAPTFEFGKVFQYLLVIFGLGIAAAIVQGIVAILVVIAGLITGGLVVIPGIFLIKALPLLKLPLIFLGVFGLIAEAAF